MPELRGFRGGAGARRGIAVVGFELAIRIGSKSISTCWE